MAIILPANTLSGGFSVDNSCRFNDGDSAYMHKTITSGGNEKTWTCSFWIKLCTPSADDYVFSYAAGSGSTARGDISFQTTDNSLSVEFNPTGSSWTFCKVSNVKFRDPSAFYNIVVACDTTQGTEANRLKVYINGTQYTLSAYPTLNFDTGFNSAVQHTVGRYENADSGYIDAYISEFYWIDGTAYAASDFGEFDEDSPTIWKPKDASGLTFGTNGFYLDFEDSSNLGNDANGGTDLTEVNLAATDSAIDTPTNNFCTLNPLDNYYPSNTLSEGNTQITTGGNYSFLQTTMYLTTGKWYWEVKAVSKASGGDEYMIGIQGRSSQGTNKPPSMNDGIAYYGVDGDTYKAAANNLGASTIVADYGDAYTAGDIIGVALDLDNNKIYWSKNGTWQDSGDPTSGATGTGALSIDAASTAEQGGYSPVAGFYDSPTAVFNFNFGSPSITISSGNSDGDGYGNFEYAVPSGYYAICTKNLAEYG